LTVENEIIVDFPLRGEWISPTTPGKRIPSHGIDKYGETYAYDFLQVKPNFIAETFYNASFFRYLLFGVSLEQCYCYGQNIFSVFDGEVVEIENNVDERKKVNLFKDLQYMYKVTSDFNPRRDEKKIIAGNYVIIKKSAGIYALFAHLKKGSIVLRVGQKVESRQFIGMVGHSGNSMAPHLHFQLMNSRDISIAEGLPCAFRSYEIMRNNKWIRVEKGIPTEKDKIRCIID
jgi:murein DD-endopeptidase MepM/ murein hydrolase activator NlpD